MEALAEKILTNAGPLGVLIVLVWMSLKEMASGRADFLKNQSEARGEFLRHQSESRGEWLKAMTDIHEEHITAREQQGEMLTKMIAAFHEVAESNQQMAAAIATCPLKR